MKTLFGSCLCVALGCHVLFAVEEGGSPAVVGNPIAPGVGLADPHVVIYGDRAFMYATHDFSADNKKFVTKDWWVWSSTDMVNWQQVGTLKPEETFLKRPSDECWAGFGTTRNGKYFWYFSAGPTEIGVVTADSPTGPWRDPIGKPLIAKGLTPTEQRDPDIFMEDDGQAYMVYGTFKYFLVRLGHDMISLAEKPHPIKLNREFGPYGAGKTDDKPSLHKRNGIYYLSWCSFYAMSTNLYGPYTYKGSVIAPENVAAEFQVDPALRKYDLWHDRHGNFFKWHNQWYYACNDKSLPGRNTFFRETLLSYVHYRENGEMAPIRLDRIGVGQYDAVRSRIEAEDYFEAANCEIRECAAGGFEVRDLAEESRLVYTNVKNLPRNARISFRVASAHPGGGNIEVHAGNVNGDLLGTCVVPDTGGWDKYQTVSCILKNQPGTNSVCLSFKGGSGKLMRLDWLKVLAPQPGSWGDQANGRYKNPILEANFPDNDIIRRGNPARIESIPLHMVHVLPTFLEVAHASPKTSAADTNAAEMAGESLGRLRRARRWRCSIRRDRASLFSVRRRRSRGILVRAPVAGGTIRKPARACTSDPSALPCSARRRFTVIVTGCSRERKRNWRSSWISFGKNTLPNARN